MPAMTSMTETPTRRRVLELVHRHGWNATAFQVLETGYAYFFDGDDACVAYVDTGRAWVAAGAPIASDEALPRVAARFVSAARAAGRRCCFFATEERLRRATPGLLRSVRIGEQPVWDPQDWSAVVARQSSLRAQLRRARSKHVSVRELEARELADGPMREALSRVIDRWLATRPMPSMDFLVRVEPFAFPAERRCLVATRDGRLIGFAVGVPVPLRDGWLLEDLVRAPEAPNGTTELLVDAFMRRAASEGSRWVTLGLAPLAGEVPAPLRLARAGFAPLYDFEGLRSFKAKLRPGHWMPIYLAFPIEQGAILPFFDALGAFARGSVLTFALRCLRKRAG